MKKPNWRTGLAVVGKEGGVATLNLPTFHPIVKNELFRKAKLKIGQSSKTDCLLSSKTNSTLIDKMENRSVIVAEYKVTSTFVIPKDIDIDDKEQVENYYVKWDILHIEMVDGRTLRIEPYESASNYDLKHPDDITMQSAEEYGVDEDYKDDDYLMTD